MTIALIFYQLSVEKSVYIAGKYKESGPIETDRTII